jgi:TolA-binding protein
MNRLQWVMVGGGGLLLASNALLWSRHPGEIADGAGPAPTESEASGSDVQAFEERLARVEQRAGGVRPETGDSDVGALSARVDRVEKRLALHASMLLPDEMGDDEVLSQAKAALAADPSRALWMYEALIDRTPPDSEAHRTALFGAMRSANQAKESDAADRYAETLAARADLTDRDRQEVAMHGAISLEHAGDQEGAARALQKIADDWAEARIAAEAHWNLALLLMRMGQSDEATVHFQAIVTKFDGSGTADDLVSQAKQQLAKQG